MQIYMLTDSRNSPDTLYLPHFHAWEHNLQGQKLGVQYLALKGVEEFHPLLEEDGHIWTQDHSSVQLAIQLQQSVNHKK